MFFWFGKGRREKMCCESSLFALSLSLSSFSPFSLSLQKKRKQNHPLFLTFMSNGLSEIRSTTSGSYPAFSSSATACMTT